MKTDLYIPRTYRNCCDNGRFVKFSAVQEESDLFVLARKNLYEETSAILSRLRGEIRSYIEFNQAFLTSLGPVEVKECSPQIIKEMANAGKIMNVGPMAAIAGAISENVVRHLAQYSEEVIVENGGDNFIISREPVTVAIYAGNSPLSMKIGVEIPAQPEGIAVCTSSGTVGHSLSFGRADAVTVLAHSGSLADAAATALCNMVKTKADISKALDCVKENPAILGTIIIFDNSIGVMGDMIKLLTFQD